MSTTVPLLHQDCDSNGYFTFGGDHWFFSHVLPNQGTDDAASASSSSENTSNEGLLLPGRAKLTELLIVCRAAYALRAEIEAAALRLASLENGSHRFDLAQQAVTSLQHFVPMYEPFGLDQNNTLGDNEKKMKQKLLLESFIDMAKEAQTALSWYNATVRLKIYDHTGWPKIELHKLLYPLTNHSVCDDSSSSSSTKGKDNGGLVGKYLLPPQMPCDCVPDETLWSAFFQHKAQEQWIGHGYAWRSRPLSLEGKEVENAAGNSMNDFDLVEDGFQKLKTASVLCLDYPLLCEDFPFLRGKTHQEIDAWVLDNAAYLSAGQAKRLAPGGDHHELLGIDQLPNGLKDVLEDNHQQQQSRSAIRIRSGGRAATFFVNDNKYKFAASWSSSSSSSNLHQLQQQQGPLLQAYLMDVKGVGTHINADIKSPHVTGLLCFADALREFAMQRLIHHLMKEKEKIPSECLDTVKFYGIIDTGLQYKKTNPATGWVGDRCVLLLRQRQSRIICNYDVMVFSGNVGIPVDNLGPARIFRRLMHKYGLSCEFFPLALLSSSPNDCPEGAAADHILNLEEAQGNFNLQADATGAYFMDLSDYYVLPDSPLPAVWRMSSLAIQRSISLGPQRYVNWLLKLGGERALKKYFFTGGEGEPNPTTTTLDAEVVQKKLDQVLVEASTVQAIRDGGSGIDPKTNLVKRLKPRYCMCWFMELDDSPFAKWCQETGKHFTAADRQQGKDIIGDITAWLP